MSITVCSISPDEYAVSRAYCHRLVVPACPKGQPYATMVISDAKDAKVFWHTLSEKDVIPVDISADEIVRDIFASEQLESKGCFVLPAGRTEPTKQELSTARQKRIATLVAWVNDGDRLYSQYGSTGIQHIPDVSKRAVVELGEQREWVFSTAAAKIECEGCGSMIKPLRDGSSPAVCPSCHAILDSEKALRLGLAEVPETKQRKQKEAVTA